MQKNEILEFLGKIDGHVGRKFELKIFGKCALLLAGLEDSVGTVDLDVLKVSGEASPEITKALEKEFGKSRQIIHGYHLEFVAPVFAKLPSSTEWIAIAGFRHIEASYLEPNQQIAAKLFSAHAETPRKKDKNDIRAALDQGIVQWARVCSIADEIFREYRFDARSDHFPDVYKYITEELMPDYGTVPLEFRP